MDIFYRYLPIIELKNLQQNFNQSVSWFINKTILKRIGYFAALLVLISGLSSCVVNKDKASQASHYRENGIYEWNFKQAGYASVHSRPPIN